MADNKKIYTIQINGIDQSIKQVDALSDALQFLDKKIKELESKKVNLDVDTTTKDTSSKDTSRISNLQTEDKLLKQIKNTEEQIANARREDYARLQAEKDILKEITNEQKKRAASERLIANNYSNTMAGMKQELADVKTVRNFTDVTSQEFDKLTKRALQLTNQLKELDEETGQLGRNVGNYGNSMQQVNIQVGNTVRTFANAREASRVLNMELKSMALNGQTDTEEFKNLRQAVMRMESAMNDAKKPMDDLMDAMESFTAIASVSEGLSALFGIDDSEIQRSIQKLVALQNVLKGIETINKQLETREGIGAWLSKGNAAADKLAASIVGVGKASKTATVATKALGTAFKVLGIGAVIAGVMALIHIVEEWSEKQKKAAEEAEEAAEKVKKAIDEQRNTFVGASATYMNTASRLSHLRAEYMTTNNELRKTSILKEASEQFKKLGLSVNSVTDAQRILVNQGDKVIEMLRLQGDAAALASLRMEAFKKSFNMLIENGYDANSASILAGSNKTVQELDKRLDQINASLSETRKKLGIDTENAIKSSGKKVAATTKDIEDELNRIRIDAMREGLNKTIKQLEEEKRQRLNKIKANGQRVAELTKSTEALYYQKIEDARRDFADNLKKQEEKMWQEIGRISSDAAAKASENIVKSSENNIDKGIDRLQQKLKAIYSNYAPDFGNISDATLSKAGSIEGAIRNGDIKAPDGRTVNEETLKATQEYLNILQDIDEVEAQIYLQRRRMGASSNLVFDKKDLEGVNKVIDDSKAILERLKQMQSESSNLNIDEEINKLYGNKFEEYQKYIDDKIKAEKEAANKSFEIEKQRIKDETKLMEERYNDEKYQELNGLAATKGNEKDALDNKLKLQEISIKEYNERIADLDAKYAELAKDKEVKYAEGAMAFADERNKKLEELEEKHRQTLLDIDHKYDGSVEEYRKEAFDEYVKYLEERKKEIEDIIRETNENIAKAEAARESIINSQSQDANEGEVDARIAALTNKLEELKKIKDAYLKDLQVSEKQMEESMVTTLLRNENYTSDLSKQFIARLGNHIKYYDEVEKLERNHYDTVLAEQKKSLASQAEADKTSAMKRLEKFEHNLESQEELELRSVQGEAEINKVREKYQREREAAEVATIKYVEETTRQHNKDSERAEIEHQNNIKEIAARTQDSIISEYRDFYSKLANIQSSSPITNDWGIINLAKTKEQNKKLLQSYMYLANQIVNQKLELQAKLDANEISFDSFTQASRELNDLQTSVASSLSDIEKNMKESFGQFWGSINQWVQNVGQTTNTILSSLSEIQSNQYEEMIEQQEKYIEEYEELLDKQKDITQEHASAVESIEDELSTARGDRRQQLIDQLNAEMAAQRASLAQEKKIEREKEKAEQKKKKLEHDQAVAKKKMQLAQAAINMAMAISMAAVNKWPIPAIPMMALAAAAGAAQIAAIQSQNIPSYGSGGVIQGKSHREGGVKVLGGQAEVEGGEYITNKITTSKNVELLEYINTKRRKISLEDLIDFYTNENGMRKRVVSNSPKTRYADGGQIATLRTDINLNDRLLTAFEDYSNRPQVVSVVEIVDKMQTVREVQTMAGLSTDF